ITLNASDVSAVPTTRTVNKKALNTDISLGADDVGAVPTARKVNNKALSADITLNASDVSAVPTTRTVNKKALNTDISLGADDVGAVPTARKINDKALSEDIKLNASDVSAIPTSDITNVTGNSKTKVINQEGITAYLATKMSNNHLGQVNTSNKFSDFLETGFYQVMIETSAQLPSDYPRNADGTPLFGYGFLEVRRLSSLIIAQIYLNSFGDVAVRQSWDGGVNWSNGGWRIVSQDLATTSGASNSKGITQKAITSMMFGIEQSWKNLTTSRSKDTEYTNTSTKIRTVSVSTTSTGNTVSTVHFYINGNLIASANSRFSESEKVANLTIPVPPGDKYKVTGNGSVLIWSEL
ncbi:hypothetical protein AB7Z98_14825, partial [Providencia manganoxydans]